MENTPLNVLVISPQDNQGRLAGVLQEVYGHDPEFSDVEFTTSLHKAIKSLEEAEFHLCFISSQFPNEELETFFSDVDKLGKDAWCSYIQVHPKITEEVDTESQSSLGFHGVVSEVGTHTDKEALHAALKNWRAEEEVIQVKVDVESAMNILLRKIDDAASNLKRGVKTKIDAVPTEFIQLKSTNDESILTTYFNKLRNKTAQAEPENEDHLSVPEGVLKKSLPSLEGDKYTGVSTRVWRRLLKKYGVEAAGPPPPGAVVPESTEVETEETDSSLPSEE